MAIQLLGVLPKMDDLFFQLNNHVFSCRVAGLLIRNGYILMQDNGNANLLMFPGGHIKYGEKSQIALLREFKEESEYPIKIDTFLGWEEIFFQWKELKTHQVCAFYTISLNDFYYLNYSTAKSVSDIVGDYPFESKLIWIKKEQLISRTIYPQEVIYRLNDKLSGYLLS